MDEQQKPKNQEESSDDKTTAIKSGSFTTKPVSENSRELFENLFNETVQQADTLSIMLPGNEKPIVFRGDQTILIGRRDDNSKFVPQVDLSRYYGILMGVSRKHAEIIIKDGRCFIEDLNSSNGTWLNEARLAPGQRYALNNGDQVRLGQLLLLVFVTGGEGQAAEVNALYLTDLKAFDDQIVQGILPAYLVEILGEYLQTLSAIQRIMREAQGKPGRDLAVQSLTYHATAKVIEIHLLHAADLVTFLQKRFQHLEDLYSDAMLEVFADQLLKEFVFRFLYEERQSYIDKLKPLLKKLFLSSLRIAPPATR
jgi:hypothetical protein